MTDSSSPGQIGPTLPPNFKSSSSNVDEAEGNQDSTLPIHDQQEDSNHEQRPLSNTDDESDDDAFGPALPPGFACASRQIGPTLPSNFIAGDEEEEDDETFGPVPEGQEDKNHQYDASQRKLKKNDQNITKREKWMLEPGKALAKTLQTKSVTQFSQKSSKKDVPLTKEQKLELREIEEKNEKMEEFLEKFEKSNKRNVSLLEQHRNDLKKNKKSRPEKTERREFDREKDLTIRPIDNKKKNSFIREASSTFTGRFSSGKFEKFL